MSDVDESSTTLVKEDNGWFSDGVLSVAQTAAKSEPGRQLHYWIAESAPSQLSRTRSTLLSVVASALLSATSPWLMPKRREESASTSVGAEERDEIEAAVHGLRRALAEASEEQFEDGIISRFWKGLDKDYGQDRKIFAEALGRLITNRNAPSEPSAMALRWLAEQPISTERSTERWLLERALSVPDAVIRDGAIVALQNLADPKTIPSLSTAAEREPVEFLRNQLRTILRDLGRGHGVPASQD